jgi:hypothetical protein
MKFQKHPFCEEKIYEFDNRSEDMRYLFQLFVYENCVVHPKYFSDSLDGDCLRIKL